MDNNTKQKIVELYSKGYTTREVGRYEIKFKKSRNS